MNGVEMEDIGMIFFDGKNCLMHSRGGFLQFWMLMFSVQRIQIFVID